QRFQRFDVGHLSVRIVEHELFYRDVIEVRKNGFVTLGEDSAQCITPGIAKAEVPCNLRLDAINTPRDHFGDPLVIVVAVREQRQPGSEIFDLEILGSGRNQVLHLGIENGGKSKTQLARILVMPVVNVPGQVDWSGADGNLQWLRGVLSCDLIKFRQADWPARDS